MSTIRLAASASIVNSDPFGDGKTIRVPSAAFRIDTGESENFPLCPRGVASSGAQLSCVVPRAFILPWKRENPCAARYRNINAGRKRKYVNNNQHIGGAADQTNSGKPPFASDIELGLIVKQSNSQNVIRESYLRAEGPSLFAMPSLFPIAWLA